MKKSGTLLIGGFWLLTLSGPALAQNNDVSGGFGLGVKTGTTGISLEVTAAITEKLNFRVGYSGLDYDTDLTETDASYEATLQKDSGSYILDWHPWAGGFRVSGGAYSHFSNEADILATPLAGSFRFNNNLYDATDVGSISGEVDFGSTVPYLGIGWGNAARINRQWGFSAEFGIQFQDSPSVSVSANGCALSGGLCSQLASDLQVESSDLQSSLQDFDLWPVLNLGVSYKF